VVEVEQDRVSGTLEANLSVQSNHLNRTMKTLTLATVSVAIAGSVFGVGRWRKWL
jgi:Mg2+ and Co2+ transporter CorA